MIFYWNSMMTSVISWIYECINRIRIIPFSSRVVLPGRIPTDPCLRNSSSGLLSYIRSPYHHYLGPTAAIRLPAAIIWLERSRSGDRSKGSGWASGGFHDAILGVVMGMTRSRKRNKNKYVETRFVSLFINCRVSSKVSQSPGDSHLNHNR